MKVIKKVVLAALRYIFLGFIVLVATVPFLWTFVSSFKTDKELFNSAFSLPASWNYINYAKVVEDTPIIQFYGNSIIIAVCTTISAVFIFSLAAYVFARFQFKGRDIIYGILSISILVPMTALIFPIYLIVRNVGLYNTKTGLIIVYTALAMPVTLFALRSYFYTIPKELEESAYIDGASFVKTYFKIIFPLATPGFASAAVLAFLLAWNDFVYAFVLTESNSVRTLPISLRYLFSAYATNYSQFFAAVSIIIFPTIGVYIMLQKHIEAGLVAGSVKG